LAQPRRRGEDHLGDERALKREIKIVIGEIRFNVLGTSPMIMERFQQKSAAGVVAAFAKEEPGRRAGLISDAVTIWRWGRQNRGALTPGRPLGSYEIWCQWARDPLR
jgi:hypothetical protein